MIKTENQINLTKLKTHDMQNKDNKWRIIFISKKAKAKEG